MQNYSVGEIASYMPSVDSRRNQAAIAVLDGRNFYFDSKGPISGFSTKMLSPFPLYSPRDVQGLRIQDRTLVFTQDAILAWRTITPFSWEVLYAFNTPLSSASRDPWSGIYIQEKLFIAQENRGLFSSDLLANTQKLHLTLQTPMEIPGLITGVKAIGMVRNRAIIVSNSFIQWSNTGDMSDLTPELGGAGFQKIGDFSRGYFIALTTFNDGFIVWTSTGGILAEFIDGSDAVWRFSALISEISPLGPRCSLRLSNGSAVFLSRQGLMISSAGGEPKAWTADLNEYLRGYMKDSPMLPWQWRLDYDESRELVYLLESLDTKTYNRGFVISPTLSKIGLFNIPTFGMLPLTTDDYGFVDSQGIAHIHAQGRSFNRECDPDNSLGLSRVYPRFQKELPIPSSTAVSRAMALAGPYDSIEVPQAGWYPPDAPYRAIVGYTGLDSWVDIGYIRSPEKYTPTGQDLNQSADAQSEIQTVVIGGIPVAAQPMVDFTTEWNAEKFYPEYEDWDSAPTVVDSDIIEDVMAYADEIIDDDMHGSSIDDEDDLIESNILTTFDVDESEDWNALDGAEDWGGPLSGLPTLNYDVKLSASQDGITLDEIEPIMSRFNTASQMFAGMSIGMKQKLRLEALAVNQYYAAYTIDVTETFGGTVG